MKLKTFFSSILFLLIIYSFSYSQKSERFKVKPGTTEWENLKSEDERFSAMQIPNDKIKGISSSELLKICLDYPAFGYISAYDDSQMAMNFIISKFNGLQELLARKDIGVELLNIYRSIDTSGYKINNFGCDEEYWTLKFMYFELILAQDQIISSFSKDQKVELLKLSMDKIKLKNNNPKFSSLNGMQGSALIISRTLCKLNNKYAQEKVKANKNLDFFNNTGALYDINTLQVIQTECLNYLNSN